jgi:hypothetical protein
MIIIRTLRGRVLIDVIRILMYILIIDDPDLSEEM